MFQKQFWRRQPEPVKWVKLVLESEYKRYNSTNHRRSFVSNGWSNGDQRLLSCLIRPIAKEHLADIYPSYDKLREAKSHYYPRKEGQIVTESSAEILLQNLLDHKVKLILELQKPVLISLLTDLLKNLKLLLKWGIDGRTSHSRYKQIFVEDGLNDRKLFLTSIVPLQLNGEQPGKDKVVVWQNLRPSIPICFQFKKETKELTVQGKSYIEKQISELQPIY